jgi:hypothetical protein
VRSLVLDRSYLQWSTRSHITDLCDGYRVIMTEALFFEIATASKGRMNGLFAKFPQRENPVVIVGHAGYLMRHEIKSVEPASPAEKLVQVSRFRLNPKFAAGSFQLTQKQRSAIDSWEKEQLVSQQHFLDRYETIQNWFPELASYHAGQDPSQIVEAQHCVATDLTLVGRAYEAIKPPQFPVTAVVGPAWAVYRWVQVQLLYALEYLRRYGPNQKARVGKVVANDVLDSQYLITATLADGLATGDQQIAAFHRLLKPHAELLQP